MKVQMTLLLLGSLAHASQAAPRSVTLSIPTMDCPVCPITIKKALGNLRGVDRVEVDFPRRTATVSFDDTQTDVEALTRATRDAGYPSSALGASK